MVTKSAALFRCALLFSVFAAIFWLGVSNDSMVISYIGLSGLFIIGVALLAVVFRSGDVKKRVLPESVLKELQAKGMSQRTFREFKALPHSLQQILGDYGEVLEKLPARPILHPISMLPYSKEEIAAAIEEAFDLVQDAKFKSTLKDVRLSLKRFVPEHEITGDSDKDVLTMLGTKKCPRCNAYLPKGVPRCGSCEYIFQNRKIGTATIKEDCQK